MIVTPPFLSPGSLGRRVPRPPPPTRAHTLQSGDSAAAPLQGQSGWIPGQKERKAAGSPPPSEGLSAEPSRLGSWGGAGAVLRPPRVPGVCDTRRAFGSLRAATSGGAFGDPSCCWPDSAPKYVAVPARGQRGAQSSVRPGVGLSRGAVGVLGVRVHPSPGVERRVSGEQRAGGSWQGRRRTQRPLLTTMPGVWGVGRASSKRSRAEGSRRGWRALLRAHALDWGSPACRVLRQGPWEASVGS